MSQPLLSPLSSNGRQLRIPGAYPLETLADTFDDPITQIVYADHPAPRPSAIVRKVRPEACQTSASAVSDYHDQL